MALEMLVKAKEFEYLLTMVFDYQDDCECDERSGYLVSDRDRSSSDHRANRHRRSQSSLRPIVKGNETVLAFAVASELCKIISHYVV